MEDGVVESETEFQWVCVAQRLLCHALCFLVCAESLLGNRCLLITGRKLSDVSQEVSLHFREEDLCFIALRIWHQRVLQKVQDVLANARKLSFNLLLVVLDFLDILCITFDILFLLNGREYTPCGPSSSHNILECDGQNVPFFKREFLRSRFGKLS